MPFAFNHRRIARRTCSEGWMPSRCQTASNPSRRSSSRRNVATRRTAAIPFNCNTSYYIRDKSEHIARVQECCRSYRSKWTLKLLERALGWPRIGTAKPARSSKRSLHRLDHGQEPIRNRRRYAAALGAVIAEGVPPKHIELLQAHFEAPRHTATVRQLAKAVGYRSYRTVNMQYGTLAHRVASRLGVVERPNGFWLYVAVDWAARQIELAIPVLSCERL